MKDRNKKRAARVAKAIRFYMLKKPREQLYDEDIIDILADIMHLCQSKKLVFDSLVKTAGNHYEHEKETA